MKPLILIILDGWGYRMGIENNGIAQAKKPNFDRLWNEYPHTVIHASGRAVGLPDGIMGNSEVGHMNLGAGRIVFTGLSQIFRAIDDGSFFSNPALLQAIKKSKENQSALHLMGLVSDGAVHSHQDHLYALLELAKKKGRTKVFIHCFMDGRDTPPTDGIKYIQKLESKIKEIGVGQIASVCGRFYAMDRDKRWDRVEKAYRVLCGFDKGGMVSAQEIIEASYKEDVGDEFIVPKVILDKKGKPVGPIQDGDSVIFFNFRADRAREITRALTESNFKEFVCQGRPKLSCFTCMAPTDSSFLLPVAFKPNLPTKIFGEILSQNRLKQLRIAETEKYAHVTFFFSGGQEKEFDGEDRVLIPSPREVATYDLKPEMSAKEITEEVCRRIESDKYDVIILNFANADMVGHTAVQKSIIKAIEVLDDCLQKVVLAVQQKGGAALILSDHGNSEEMVDAKGEPHTAHTLNPVPCILVSDKYKRVQLKKEGGKLCDVAPTLLDLLEIKKPKEMTGESLIV